MPGRNIFGESFKPYVSDQINIRQQKLAKSNQYNPDTLKFINNRTSWLRLASGVNVSQDRASSLGVTDTGAELAKKYILYSARFNNEFTSNVGYSVNSSYGFLSTSEYGLVPPPGILSAEIKPMNDKGTLRTATVQIICHNLPQFKIIEALYLRLKYSMLLEWGHTTWFDNKGNLQNAGNQDWALGGFLNGTHSQDTLIIALENAREQSCGNYDGFFGWVRNFNWTLKPNGEYDVILELISLGDTIESLKLNTNYPQPTTTPPSEVTTTSTPKPAVIANKNKSTIHQILYAIKTEIDTQGYLDGPNLGGRASLSAEEIVRITKLHSQYDLQGINYKSPDENPFAVNGILTYQEGIKMNFSQLTSANDGTNGFFYYIKLGTLLRIIESFLLKYDTSRGTAGSYKPLFYIDHNYDTNICLTLPRQISTDPRICVLPSAKVPASTGDNQNNQAKAVTVYTKISFQKKIEEINWGYDNEFYEQLPSETVKSDIPGFDESRVITQWEFEDEEQEDATDQDVKRPVKIVTIDKAGNKQSYDSGDTIGPFYLDSTTVDTNNKVLTKNDEGEVSVEANPNNTAGLGPFFRVDPLEDYPFLGKFMHIHVNLDFISTLLSDNIDEEGKISIYTFLEQLMQGIQDATGNINDYRILYDELSNTFYINDNTILPNVDKYFNIASILPTMINAHVFKDSIGSFVTDVSLKSELNNNYATMISVGAQSNGNVVGENATAFSKWNVGYEDRIITDRGSIVDTSTQPQEGSGSKSPEQVYVDNLVKYGELNNKINSGQVTAEEITNNGQAVVDMLKYEIAYFTQQSNMPGQGFLPLNLQLTMMGLSGPRLFETYTIDETLLPDNYKNNIKFLTKGITHRVDSNGWMTTLDSFTAPRLDGLKKAQIYWPPESQPPQPSSDDASASPSGTVLPISDASVRTFDKMQPSTQAVLDKDGLVLVREGMTGNRTYGALYYKKQLIAVTVEDLVRDSKIKKQTAIPANSSTGYNVTLGTTSNDFIKKSAVDFGKGLWAPRIGTDASAVNLDGPGNLDFAGIRIHAGASEKSSEGCLIVSSVRNKDGTVQTDFSKAKDVTRLIYDNKIKKIYIVNDFT